jgi:hypothetical protein
VWSIDATGCLADDGNVAVFAVVDHCPVECLGVCAAIRGGRCQAFECLLEAVPLTNGRYEDKFAKDTRLRHDHGSQFISHAHQDEVKTLGIESSPSFVRQSERNGCVERFIRTLKEQLLWPQRFRTVKEFGQALGDFARRFSNHRIIGRIAVPNARSAPTHPPRGGRVDPDFNLSQKLDAIHIHDLQHAFGMRLSKAGVPLRTTQSLMRHLDPSLTANVDTDLNLLDVVGAVAIRPDLPLGAIARSATVAR